MEADPGHDVHVVWWRFDGTTPDRLAAFEPWLSPTEHLRMARFRFDRDRVQFLASRILLRHTLGAALQRPPASLQFSTDEHGVKPRLVAAPRTAPEPESPLHFSLTHTGVLVACAFTRSGEVGLDAEAWSRPVRVEALAPRVLSPREARAVAAMPADAQPRRFLEYWTVKEAWLKATGTGLSVSPSSVEVDQEGDPMWRVRLLDACPDHAMALVSPRRAADGHEPDVHVEAFELPPAPDAT